MHIKIIITDKIARADKHEPLVCGNSDYIIDFTFDAEWNDYHTKTARFIFDDRSYTDVVFTGTQCQVPVLKNTHDVIVGVFAGDLKTTTPAYLHAQRSILCGGGAPADPDPDVYNQIMELLNKAGGSGSVTPEQIQHAVEENAKAIADLSEEKVDKQQGDENAGKVLYVTNAGSVDGIGLGAEIMREYDIGGKNIANVEWAPGIIYDNTDGVFVPSSSETAKNFCFRDILPVDPGETYCLSMAETIGKKAYGYLYQYNDEGHLVSQTNYFWTPSSHLYRVFNTVTDATGIRIRIFVEVFSDTEVTWRDCIPKDFMIEKGSVATSYEPCSYEAKLCLNPKLVYDKMADAGLVQDRVRIPSYYHSDGYLQTKCDHIRELLKGCAGNGDAFMFVTDQHWEQNAQQSPALMHYISGQVHIPRLFSGGDVADGQNEKYVDILNKSFGGSIHYVVGNHEYTTGGLDGNELAYVFDMGKAEQIGNAFRHYYYVDNPQQKLRYIVLNSFDVVDGTITTNYEESQIAWLRDVALNVDEGWTVLVFTHALYHPNPANTALTPYPESAQSVADVLDAAECDVACIIQGHHHRDHVWHSNSGIPVVTVMCDKYQPWMSGETNNEPWLSNRVAGTITEQAFDVVVLDKEQRKLTFVRIGAPADNWTDGVSTGTVEERVVTY